MTIPADKLSLIHLHIQKYAGACKLCGNTHWEVEKEMAVMPTLDQPNNSVRLDSVLPFAICYCSNCRNTVMFNAVKMGWL